MTTPLIVNQEGEAGLGGFGGLLKAGMREESERAIHVWEGETGHGSISWCPLEKRAVGGTTFTEERGGNTSVQHPPVNTVTVVQSGPQAGRFHSSGANIGAKNQHRKNRYFAKAHVYSCRDKTARDCVNKHVNQSFLREEMRKY